MMADLLTAAEAADRLGKSRRTIGRMLAAGDFPGAERTPQGWRIPAAALDAHTDPVEASGEFATGSPSTSAALADLRAEVEQWRRRAEVAEAVAAERAEALADARASLALAQRLAALTITETVAPIPQAVEQTTGTPSTLRRWLPRRWR